MFQVVFLKNRGVLVGGESVEEVFHLLRRVMNAVDTQVCINASSVISDVVKQLRSEDKDFMARGQGQVFVVRGQGQGLVNWS